jgi:hypothetical protein
VIKIESILNILSDGKYHKINDLKSKIKADNFEMLEILNFMERFDFVETNGNKVKTKKIFKSLIKQETSC